MTVSNTNTKVSYTGDGATDTYVFDFPVDDSTEIRAQKDGVDFTALSYTLNSDQVGDPGGVVTLDAASEDGANYTFYRVTQQTQQVDLPYRGPFPAKVVEAALDKLQRQIQETAEELSRKLGVPLYSANTPTNLVLPGADDGSLLGWVGTDLANVTPPQLAVADVSWSATETVNVPTDQPTIPAAVEYLATRRALFSNSAAVFGVVNIETGHALTAADQLEVDALDLSWITITSVDASVDMNVSALTISFNGIGTDPRAVFAARNGGALPRINFLLNTTGIPNSRNYYMYLTHGARAVVSPGAGFSTLLGNGAYIYAGSNLVADGAVMTNATVDHNVFLSGSHGSLRQATLGGASSGDSPVRVTEGSVLAAPLADFTGAPSTYCAEISASRVDLRSATLDGWSGVQATNGAAVCLTSAADGTLSNRTAEVLFGATVSAFGTTGTFNVTVNTITSNGIVFK